MYLTFIFLFLYLCILATVPYIGVYSIIEVFMLLFIMYGYYTVDESLTTRSQLVDSIIAIVNSIMYGLSLAAFILLILAYGDKSMFYYLVAFVSILAIIPLKAYIEYLKRKLSDITREHYSER